MAHILVVEDEPAIAAGLEEALTLEGFTVSVERDGEGGLAAARKDGVDCVLLDIMLPLMNGRDVCKTLREERSPVPIIMLTSKAEEADIVLGLEIGADDYITKPFRLGELTARIRALLRRRHLLSAPASEELQFGTVHVDYRTLTVHVNGEPVHMSVREIEVLRFLADNADTIVTRDMLLDKVWGYDAYPTTRTVDNYILSLRKKLEDDPSDPKHILTIHGKGYRFVRSGEPS